jgi:hypothetical protein
MKEEAKITELKHFGLNVWDKKIFLVRYRGFSNVVAEDEIKDWCLEVDQLKKELKII